MRGAFSLCMLSAALAAAAALDASAAPLGPMGATAADRPVVIRVGGDDDWREGQRYRNGRRGPVVDAPYAHVDAGDPVVVDAPFAHVRVGRDRIRVRAPFVNLSIPRWND
jgi:hypothetical protein